MNYISITLAAVYVCSMALAFTLQDQVSFARGYKAGVAAAVPAPRTDVNLDNACTAWFFATNLKAAKARMCRGH